MPLQLHSKLQSFRLESRNHHPCHRFCRESNFSPRCVPTPLVRQPHDDDDDDDDDNNNNNNVVVM